MLNNFFNNILILRSVSPLVADGIVLQGHKCPTLIGLGTKNGKNKM